MAQKNETASGSVTASDRSTITRAVALIRMFRRLSGEMPMQQADVLLTVAGTPGITMSELSEATGLSQSACSRNVAALSTFHRLGHPGMGLVEATPDPRESRRKVMYLTQAGRVFVTRLMRTYDPEFSLGADADRRIAFEDETTVREEGQRIRGVNVKVPRF